MQNKFRTLLLPIKNGEVTFYVMIKIIAEICFIS